MPKPSSTSAGATYLNKAERIEKLRSAAQRAVERLPHIQRMILFGSLVTGIPTPRSDADVLVVVESSSYRQPRDRVPEILRAMAPLPCPVDLYVLTAEEVKRGRRQASPLVGLALSTGIDLISPADNAVPG